MTSKIDTCRWRMIPGKTHIYMKDLKWIHTTLIFLICLVYVIEFLFWIFLYIKAVILSYPRLTVEYLKHKLMQGTMNSFCKNFNKEQNANILEGNYISLVTPQRAQIGFISNLLSLHVLHRMSLSGIYWMLKFDSPSVADSNSPTALFALLGVIFKQCICMLPVDFLQLGSKFS